MAPGRLRARTLTPLAALLVPVASLLVAAGCGQRDGPPPEPAEEVAEREQENNRSAEEERSERNDDAEAPRACREVVERAPLPEGVERDLLRDCRGLAEGDEETVRRVAASICRTVARWTVPFPLREPAAQACERAIPAPEGRLHPGADSG